MYIDGEYIYMEVFDNEIDATETFDMYLVHNKIDHIELNFPDKKEEYIKRKYTKYERNLTSKYYGVGFHKQHNKYQARVKYEGKMFLNYLSENEIECAKRYDKCIFDNNILGKKFNFPEDYPNYENRIVKTKYEVIENNIIRLLINNNKDIIIKINKEDYDKVKYYAWCWTNQYITGDVNGKTVRLHRFLMDETDPDVLIDHINSDPCDNTRENLRKSCATKNAQNKSKVKNKSSIYLGVCYSKDKKKWICKVEKKYLGHFNSEIDAARKRDLYILLNLQDSHYKLNFEWSFEDINKWKSILKIN